MPLDLPIAASSGSLNHLELDIPSTPTLEAVLHAILANQSIRLKVLMLHGRFKFSNTAEQRLSTLLRQNTLKSFHSAGSLDGQVLFEAACQNTSLEVSLFLFLLFCACMSMCIGHPSENFGWHIPFQLLSGYLSFFFFS